MKVTERVWAFAEPVVEGLGCKIWDVEYVREGGEWFLRIYIDKDGGVGIDDCEAVSRRWTRFWTGRTRSPTATILR